MAEIAAEIDEIDRSLEPKEFEFSLTLGAMAHRVYGLLLAIEVLLGSVLLVAIVWRTFRLLQERHRIEQTLVAERQWATVTLASIGEAVVSTDRQGRVIYMNPAAQRLIQRSVPETGAAVRYPPLTEMIRLIERETGIERALLTEELLDGRIAGLHSEIDHLLVRSDGTSVPVLSLIHI